MQAVGDMMHVSQNVDVVQHHSTSPKCLQDESKNSPFNVCRYFSSACMVL